jgi:hypothetical protein
MTDIENLIITAAKKYKKSVIALNEHEKIAPIVTNRGRSTEWTEWNHKYDLLVYAQTDAESELLKIITDNELE